MGLWLGFYFLVTLESRQPFRTAHPECEARNVAVVMAKNDIVNL